MRNGISWLLVATMATGWMGAPALAHACQSDADCDDGIACTAGSCDVASGCVHAPDDAACDDVSPCARAACEPASGCASTPQALGDVTTIGALDVSDIQCEILVVLALQSSSSLPGCLEGSLADTDLNCDGATHVADVLLAIRAVLGLPLPADLDADAADCPDVCPQGAVPEAACEDGVDNNSDGATDCADGDCAAAPGCLPTGYVFVAAGTFTMGSPPDEPGPTDAEGPQHVVTLTHDFYMKATEVTQAEWYALMGTDPSWFSGCEDCPVERVNKDDALAYANARSQAEGLAPCYILTECTGTPGVDWSCSAVGVNAPGGNPYLCEGYRLPTEAEWEYALPCGHHHGVLQRRYHGRGLPTRPQPGRHRVVLRQRRLANAARGAEGAECVGVVRHGGQRVGTGVGRL